MTQVGLTQVVRFLLVQLSLTQEVLFLTAGWFVMEERCQEQTIRVYIM